MKKLNPASILIIALTFSLVSGCSSSHLSFDSSYSSNNMTSNRIAKNIPKYQSLANESWPIIQSSTSIHANDTHRSISDIRHRLMLLGDLNSSILNFSDIYDQYMVYGIMQFQWRHGLKQTGIIDKKTLRALNMSPIEKKDLLITSMHKWSKYSDIDNSHYIVVNIPDNTLNIMKNGTKIISLRTITGTTWNQTPELDSYISTIVFNPTWNIPKSIVKNEIAPKMVKNPNYLQDNKIYIYKNWNNDSQKIDPASVNWNTVVSSGSRLRFTQSSGTHNVLGRVKFLFNNPYDIYIHDTINKQLFDNEQRNYSHGCVRTEAPLQLAQYLLNNSGIYDINPHAEGHPSKAKQYINLKEKVPLHITYIVAWVDEYGFTHFRNNIYNKSLY